MPKRAMSKKTLNQINLEALGAAQLAALLMEVSTGNADIKRRLRLELSHQLGATELAHDVRKRLTSLRKSKSFVGWRKRKALVKDLETQVAMITQKIAPDDPSAAFELLWAFLDMAPAIHSRTDDSKGDVSAVFHAAMENLGDIAQRADTAPTALADLVFGALVDNGYTQWDGIIAVMAPALGDAGLSHLEAKIKAYGKDPATDVADEHEAIQFLRQLRGGNTAASGRKSRLTRQWLRQIAMVTGDAQAYVTQFTAHDLRRKKIAAQVATVLLGDDQAQAALEALLAADDDTETLGQDAWDAAYIAALAALNRMDEAQAHRLACFHATLHPQHLRDYLKVLPDFEDVEAEDLAKAHALSFQRFPTALNFFFHWPDLLGASKLIQTRTSEINGDHYALLSPIADALRDRYPLAAVLVWRKMIDYALGQGRSSRYTHAAEHLADCAALDVEISDYAGFATHEIYVNTLKTLHERKASFWEKVSKHAT